MTAIHLKFNGTPESFTAGFCSYMESAGYSECGEDDAEIVYSFRISEGWVTVGGCGTDAGIAELTSSLGLNGITVETAENDTAVIRLYSETGAVTAAMTVPSPAEEQLRSIAGMLGIRSEKMLAQFEDLGLDDDTNITIFFQKKVR